MLKVCFVKQQNAYLYIIAATKSFVYFQVAFSFCLHAANPPAHQLAGRLTFGPKFELDPADRDSNTELF